MGFEGTYDKITKSLSFNPTISIGENSLLLNGELYNYFQLMKEHDLRNDSKTSAEVFLRLLTAKGFESLNYMNADYSIAYKKGDKIFLLRDLIGTHTLYYVNNNEFFKFKDEEMEESVELPAGTLLEYDLESDELRVHEELKIPKLPTFNSYEEMIETIAKEVFRSISSRVYNLNRFGILNKGNTETKIIVKLCNDLKTSNVMINPSPERDLLPKALSVIKELTDNNNFDLVQFYFACKQAKEEKIKVIVSDLGSGLLTQDAVNPVPYYYISKHFDLQARFPFLDLKLVQALLRVDAKYKKNLFTVLLEQLE